MAHQPKSELLNQVLQLLTENGTDGLAEGRPRSILGREMNALGDLWRWLSATAGCAILCVTSRAQTPVAPPAKEHFLIYLLMGQSNMAGRGDVRQGLAGGNPRILSLDTNGQWVIAKDPLHPKVGNIEPGVGPGMSFAVEMTKADPAVTIGLVPCAVGGTPLKRWVKAGDLYEKAVSRAKVAAQTGVIKGVLWHQGESDSDKKENADTYESRLTRMFKDLRADLGTPDLPIVVGQLGEFLPEEKHPFTDPVRAAIKHIPQVLPNVGFTDSAGLKDKGDKLHFDSEAQREFGRRYANAIRSLERR